MVDVRMSNEDDIHRLRIVREGCAVILVSHFEVALDEPAIDDDPLPSSLEQEIGASHCADAAIKSEFPGRCAPSHDIWKKCSTPKKKSPDKELKGDSFLGLSS